MAKATDHRTFVSIVDSTGDIIDTVAAAVSQTDGSVFTPGADSFAPIGGVRQDTPSQVADGSAGVYRMTADRQMPVAVEEALPAGDNNIGNVDLASAIPAGTNNIGDVDVLTQVGAGNMANAQVSVTTTATQIVAARATRRSVLVVNQGDVDVYVGVATVTTANGVRIPPNGGLTFAFTGVLQGITASGSATVSYAEEYD